ncbi:RING finger protein 24-like isoform X7 [Branchiostoma floridae]|uniref:RING finger protein 24-like isoform X7 n=4 Tax=Branchiostoma TaxID=7737 RepID=A0A9J7L2K1_BRAFL|nr:PREDICTED: RING finger protein 24-like isoform X2 [Branchiostoma belcheri]XP_035674275.1 RING finger protein 24-like isoform X7 [Branchiostoma floridae]KAI8499542.1 RING finger protein 24 [Branchiostoma belcheri]CAH1257612.1 RNF24 [Branchiostoma lanceolatum]
MYLTPTYMMSSDMLLHFRVSLPMISVGLFIFVLSLIFCCYLVRLRREARLERGYKKITYKKKKCSSNETCAVCLEDFKLMEEIGLCPCGHAFHRKCISKWLEIRNTCPMCNSQVKQQASERSTLVRTVDLPVTRV